MNFDVLIILHKLWSP